MARLVLSAVVVGLAVTFGCLSPHHYYEDGTTGQGGTNTTTSTGSTGGGLPCSPIDDNNPCTDQACFMGTPINTPSPVGASCLSTTNASAKVCDGNGECVACVASAQCTGSNASCDMATHTCISCSDTLKNGSETGVDCGGTCPKCNGDICSNDGECSTGACNGMCRNPVFRPCVEDAECASLRCLAKVCTACSTGSECASTQCNQGKCKSPAGGICKENSDCAGDACNMATHLCAKANGNACNADVECSSYRCNSQKCSACSMATQVADCVSDKCDANGNCLLVADAFCTGDDQCASNMCKGFPARCQ